MDQLEYIPGDLVMTNGVPLGTAQNVVYRVTSSDPSKTLKLDDGTVLKGVVCLENIFYNHSQLYRYRQGHIAKRSYQCKERRDCHYSYEYA